MPARPPPAPRRPAADRAALVAHAALFDHLVPVCGSRVLVHDAARPTGFHAVQLAKAAGALTVAAAVTGPAEASAARRAGADLVIDRRGGDPVALLRRHTGHERPIQRIVQGRFGRDTGIDLAVLARGGVIAVHGLGSSAACSGWWPDLLAAGITLKLVAFGALPPAALERARADVDSLRAAGRWRDAAA